MIAFSTFFENKTLGLTEKITIKGVGSILSKVDSGNEAYNVLHGTNLKQSKDGIVSFITVGDKKITKPIAEFIDINIGSGNVEKRPVISFDVSINGKEFKDVKFSIADRSQNKEKVLLGKPFIAALGGLIDVTK